jgi:YbbR domain-containing protein
MIFRFVRWFVRNFGTLLLAFLLALVVWVSAVIAADPNEERGYIRPLPVIGLSTDLVMINEMPGQVRITLEAPRSILDELTNTPSLLSAWVDLAGLGPGEHTVKTQVRWEREPIRLVKVEPAEFMVNLEKFIEKTLPITLIVQGDTALGYSKGTPTMIPDEVLVSGREPLVNQVSQVQALLDIKGANETVEVSIPLIPIDQNGEEVLNVTITPKTTLVIQPISLLGGYKNVVVKVVTFGQIAEGYRLTNISITPLTVTVFSDDLQRINELPGYIETEPVDLTGLNDDIEIRVDLSLPEGVRPVGEQSVLVQISVAAIEGTLPFTLPVEAIGLSPTLIATISPPVVDILALGALPILDKLTADSFRVIVDLTGLEPGVYQLPVLLDLVPESIEIESVLPESVEVVIELVPTPTPTPLP